MGGDAGVDKYSRPRMQILENLETIERETRANSKRTSQMGRRGPPDVPDAPIKELDWTKSIKPKNELALTYRDSAKPFQEEKRSRPWGKAIIAGLIGLGFWPVALAAGACIGFILYPVALAIFAGARPVEETLEELRGVTDKAQTILFLPAVMFLNQLNHELIEIPE